MTTALRHVDPRTRIAAAAGAAFCFSFVRSVPPAGLCLALALAAALVPRVPARPLLKRLAAANIFILFVWLTVPLSASDPAAGARLALLITLKCNAILLIFSALMEGISLPRVGCALERLRLPPKLVFLFLFTCRYIHVVGDEWRRLWTAAKLRGFLPRNSFHTYSTVGSMLGLTFVNAIDRSQRVYEAMLLRGFAGSFRTVAEPGRGSRADALFAAAFFAGLCGILLLDLYWG